MAKKLQIAANPEVDPTMPKVSVTIGGVKHYLVFTFGALAMAETKLREHGQAVNLLVSFLDFYGQLDATRLVPLLFAALITHQPEVSPVTVANMLKLKDIPAIMQALLEAYLASQDTPDEEAPPLA